ncbi:MAG: polyprenyl synthetase family protein [Burkholderiaceae bacterium]|nr:MAG: polyprenyl synthetase family protein [Burkholderiaceae bacterium]
MASPELSRWMQASGQHIEQVLDRLLPSVAEAPGTLQQAMRYAVLQGGKRMRPLLVYAAGELGQAPQAALDHAAAAVELIHAYSLVHDDLPCMDNDVLRRGKPTVHVQFGEAMALLAGDALQTLAFEVLTIAPEMKPSAQLQMLHVLAQASGAAGMAGGQAIDLDSVGVALPQAQLEQMHARKTGALLAASIRLGVLCGTELSPQQQVGLAVFARHLGLAFQVADDVLDVAADTATLGKTAGKDAQANKPTYVALMGLEEARAYAAHLLQQALQALECFGPEAERLRQLAGYSVHRTY